MSTVADALVERLAAWGVRRIVVIVMNNRELNMVT